MSVSPFANGTQFGAWCERNCFRCVKYNACGDGPYACDLDLALLEACIRDGQVTEEVAIRIGYVDEVPGPFTWDCPERQLEAAS